MSSCGDGLRAGAGAAVFGAGLGASATGAGFGGSGGASPGRPRMRRFLTSTTTVFERPWLKLCLTLPVSTVRLRPNGGRVPSFGFSVWSAILFLRSVFFSRAGPQGGFLAFQTSFRASESSPPGKRVLHTRSGGGIGQGDVYHIVPPKCHGQDSARQREYHPLLLSAADPPGLVEFAAAVLGGVGRVDEEVDLARSRGRLDLVGAVDQVARARLHAEPVERGLAQSRFGPSPEVRRDLHVIRLERTLERRLELALRVRGVELGVGDADPRTAPRRPRADVGRDAAVGTEREANELLLRAFSAGKNAGAFGDVAPRRRPGSRSAARRFRLRLLDLGIRRGTGLYGRNVIARIPHRRPPRIARRARRRTSGRGRP